jgi:hypothetical protein
MINHAVKLATCCDGVFTPLVLVMQIQILEYDSEREAIRMTHTFDHPQEIWQIAPCPSLPAVMGTVHNEGAAVVYCHKNCAMMWSCC